MGSPARLLRPGHRAVAEYYRALAGLKGQKVSHEQAVRSAYQGFLGEAAKPSHWIAIPELGSKVRGKRVVPDGTLRDRFHLPRGYWEAKDAADDLDVEIAAKIAKGYPTNNTVFWTPDRGVLYQDGKRKIDVSITSDEAGRAAFCDLHNALFTYVDKPIVDFDQAVKEFTQRVPELGRRLAEIIAEAHKTNHRFKESFAAFFELCRASLNPSIAVAAVDEMLVQHLLTERLFKTVFKSPEFVRKNVIAAEVERVIDALASKSFTREEFLASLDRFYVAIENAAGALTEFSDKQHFLNSVYERFFQGYCVRTADTHGIVYTPQPIVDFMCASVEHVLKEEFGKSLGDDGVLVLDPCTGTGNFVVNLMRRAAARGRRHLQRMYREQLFANEIMLLPYYIAALNTEHAYFEEAGQYEAFEGLCFVDTLELAEEKQAGLFTEVNAERVERQKRAPITVVIGNPPYNVGQVNENDNNRNRAYRIVDERVARTYVKDSSARLRRQLYDPYVRFFRWATDRLQGRDGVVCFVSNNSFVDNVTFDGMRRHLTRDFDLLYHLNLKGNVREDPSLSGTQYNVFGIQVGVGITIAIRHRAVARRSVQYFAVPKTWPRVQKLEWLGQVARLDRVEWMHLHPDERGRWLTIPRQADFHALVPLGVKHDRLEEQEAVFAEFSRGVATNADSYVYDWSEERLRLRVASMVDDFNAQLDRWRRKGCPQDVSEVLVVDERIHKWIRNTKRTLARGSPLAIEAQSFRVAQYRPFARVNYYAARAFSEDSYRWPRFLPGSDAEHENRVLVVSDIAGRGGGFSVLATRYIADLHLCATADSHQCFPFYVYDEDGSNRRENITDRALGRFREHYNEKRVSKWDIFYYVYAILHHPGYREQFAENLKRELPRVPFAPDFRAFVNAGKRLAAAHVHYDDSSGRVVQPHPLVEEWAKGKPKSYRVDRMVLSNDKTAVVVNESLTLRGLTPDVFAYRLGNRSALDWVIDQYQVHSDKRSGITSDPNLWGEEHDDEEYIVRLVKQVVAVSLETNDIVGGLPVELGDGKS